MSLFSESGGQRKKGDRHITVPNKTIEVAIKFKVRGNLRFLSHAETVKVFQRACVRAGIRTAYSQGFNPRPKMSLPLPRSVGVEVDDDLLCLRVCCDPNEPPVANHQSRIKAGLSEHLPEGFELISVRVAEAKASFQASRATYVLAVRRKYLNEKLKTRIKHLLASASLNLQRRIGPKSSKFKNVDVRGFLKSVEADENGVVVECKISSAGSIRIGEILELLELDYRMLAAPIRRTNVQWQVGES